MGSTGFGFGFLWHMGQLLFPLCNCELIHFAESKVLLELPMK